MTTDAMTVAECLKVLAPRFPMFRRECQYKDATKHFVLGVGLTIEALRGKEQWHKDGRCGCHGLGWLPLAEHEVHLEMVLFAAYTLGARDAIEDSGWDLVRDVFWQGLGAKTPQDFVEAALRALVAAQAVKP